MVPAVSSSSLPVQPVSERLPVLPGAAAYARAVATNGNPPRPIVIPLDSSQTNPEDAPEALGENPTAGEATVQDAALPPRRRAQDAARAPGFPASPYVAQLLSQEAFPPAATNQDDALAAYQATIARNGAPTSPTISLSA